MLFRSLLKIPILKMLLYYKYDNFYNCHILLFSISNHNNQYLSVIFWQHPLTFTFINTIHLYSINTHTYTLIIIIIISFIQTQYNAKAPFFLFSPLTAHKANALQPTNKPKHKIRPVHKLRLLKFQIIESLSLVTKRIKSRTNMASYTYTR